jgi:argonaute-like protein implicated in RNA metabolism and viral defense
MFVFPENERARAQQLARAVLDGLGGWKGFAQTFQVPVDKRSMQFFAIQGPLDDPALAARAYQQAINDWAAGQPPRDPDLAFIVVPKTERWQTESAYYAAKAAFAARGVPTQMATVEMIADADRFKWSVADLSLAAFAKLGGVPWTVAAPPGDNDLIIGVGRRDIGPQRRQIFGYAVTFVSNGVYRHTHSVTPASDQRTYQQRLGQALTLALRADRDQPVARVVVHLASRAGRREIEAVRAAMIKAGLDVPVAFLRLDDTALWDMADTRSETWAAPSGLVARLGARRSLLWSTSEGPAGPPDGALLVELDERSTIGPEHLDDLVAQVFRLVHANWRKFNAPSRPATLAYGEQLANLVGHLEDVGSWKPEQIPAKLHSRPWFL